MWTLILTGLFLDHVTGTGIPPDDGEFNLGLGTTPDLQEVIIGRCNDYDETRFKDILPRVPTSCTELWTLFSNAFAYKEPCNVTESSYLPFLVATKQVLPENKSMFWSVTYSLAHTYANEIAKFITLEDTLAGYLADTLNWCGQVSPPGVNYTVCPSSSECPYGPFHSFWASASKVFASSAKGNVTLMVDGSNPNRTAYSRDSYFGQYELPNLNVRLVTAINVIVVHALDRPKLETCTSGSLLTLKEDATNMGLQYSCHDKPESVLHLLCAEQPDSRECRFATDICGLNNKAVPKDLLCFWVILVSWVLFSKL